MKPNRREVEVIGAFIFVVFFLLFLAVTLGLPELPPGDMIHELLAIQKVPFPVLGIPAWLLITAIVNGVVYGFIVWLVYSIASYATRSRKKEEGQIYAPPPSTVQRQYSLPPSMPLRQHSPPSTSPPPRHTPPSQMTFAQQAARQVPAQAPPRAPTAEPTPTPAVSPPRYTPQQQSTLRPSELSQNAAQPEVQSSRTSAPPAIPMPFSTSQPIQAPTQPQPSATTTPDPALKEEFTVSSETLVDRVRDLLHEGNVTRIVIKDDKGRVLLDMPASVGVAGTIAAPWLAGLGAVAALATKCTISVVRKE